MNEKGEYISDGSGNIILYGPNYHFKEGIYDITLEYEVLESKDNIAGALKWLRMKRNYSQVQQLQKMLKRLDFMMFQSVKKHGYNTVSEKPRGRY